MGYQFGQDQVWGLETSAFYLPDHAGGYSTASDALGNPPIYLPFNNVVTGVPGSYTISDPLLLGGTSGTLAISLDSLLWGADINLTRRLRNLGDGNIEIMAGFRFLDLEEGLNINAFTNGFVAGIQISALDSFVTTNQFYGGQLGARYRFRRGDFTAELLGQVALGVTHQAVIVNGVDTESGAGAPNPGTFPGGIFSQQSNIGVQVHDVFSVVPHAQIKFGWDFSSQLRVTAGFDFLYWNQVVRPGDQVDTTIDMTQANGGPPAARPGPLFNRSDLFVYGASVGLEWRR